MKKLLIVTDTFLPRMDGITKFLVHIIPELRDEYEITVLTTDFGPIDLAYHNLFDLRLIRFKPMRFKYASISPSIPRFGELKEEVKNTDIVFIQTGAVLGMLATIYANKFNKPSLAYIHTVDWEWYSKTARIFKRFMWKAGEIYSRFVYNNVDTIIVPFLELKEEFKRKKIINTHIVVIGMGVNLKRFVPPPDKDEAKKRLGIPANRFVIGYVGRLTREKGVKTLVDAFKDIDSAQKSPREVSLLIVGKGVKSMEETLKKGKNIIWVGHQDDVVPYLQAMDVFVLPSHTETTSLATIEAMSCRVPVVVTPVGYVKEYIKDKRNGMVFPPGNALVLKLKIRQLMEDEDLRKELSDNAMMSVETLFDWEKTVKELKFLLRQF